MTHPQLSVIEYSVLPFLLVFTTIFVRGLTKKSSRINWRQFLCIGLDIILMCSFASFIYGISIYNHFESNSDIPNLFITTFSTSFVMLICAVMLSLFIRHLGEYSLGSLLLQNIVGIVCLFYLLSVIPMGNSLFAQKPLNQTVKNIIKPDSSKIK
jgi:hypothetical protein